MVMGFSVVSLALQLADQVIKPHDFWQAVSEAPDDINSIFRDLNILSTILTDIAFREQRYGPSESSTIAPMERCAHGVKNLQKIADEFETCFRSDRKTVRKWTSVKVALKQEKPRLFRESLEETKSTLMLALQSCQ